MLLVCTGCGKQFRAPDDASGKSFACKSCGSPLEPPAPTPKGAGWVRHARAAQKPFPWVLVAVIGGVVLIGIVGLVLSQKSNKPSEGWARAAIEREERAKREEQEEEERRKAREETKPLALHEDEAVALVRDYLAALDEGDETRMRIAFDVETHLQRAGSAAGLSRPWEAMTADERRAAVNRFFTDQLSPEGRAKWKARDRSGETFIQTTGRAGEGGVSIELRDPATGEIVERTFVLAVGPRRKWQIVDARDKLIASGRPAAAADAEARPGKPAIPGGKDPAAKGDEESELRPSSVHRVLGGGREIRQVEYPEDISSETRAKVEGLVRTLTDPNASRESVAARKQLVEMGRPAIPGLLNRLVGLDLAKEDDVLVANQVDGAMREITGQDSGFAPHMQDETLGGSDAKSKEKALRRWFGWWYSQGHLMKGAPKK
jgi:hypothetical protein